MTQDYCQLKIDRKTRIFSLGRKNNILKRRKECENNNLGPRAFAYTLIRVAENQTSKVKTYALVKTRYI